MRLLTSKSPRIVGREVLFEDVLDDFLHALPRQKPWMISRYEDLLQGLHRHLDAVVGHPAPLTAFDPEHVALWCHTLGEGDLEIADEMLRDLDAFLVAWGWRPQRAS